MVSLVRRESYSKVLGYMLTWLVSSNIEIAVKLGLKESVVSRCIKELIERASSLKNRQDHGTPIPSTIHTTRESPMPLSESMTNNPSSLFLLYCHIL